MSERKRFDTEIIDTMTFEEDLPFSYATPHSIRIKSLKKAGRVPPHYAPTMEILLCERVDGSVQLGKLRHVCGEREAIVIPPGMIHSTINEKCQGRFINLKISFSHLAHYIDIDNIYDFRQLTIWNIPLILPSGYFDRLLPLIERMIERDDNIFERMRCLLSVFEILSEGAASGGIQTVRSDGNGDIKRLIEWTNGEIRDGRRVTLEGAARQLRVSKAHFCKCFKEISGDTYIAYVNRMRIAYSCELLKQGYSATDCCYKCGLDNVSYFVQLFKKVTGLSTEEYRRSRLLAE